MWGSAILAVLLVLSVRILQRGHIPLHSTVHGGAAIGAFILMTTIAFSGFFSWASYAADYSRYQEKDYPSSPIFRWTLGGLCASYIWTYVIGLAGAESAEQPDSGGCALPRGRGRRGYVGTRHRRFRGDHEQCYERLLRVPRSSSCGVRLRRNWSAAIGTMIAFGLILWLHGGNTSASSNVFAL